jgi:hypothetical protein
VDQSSPGLRGRPLGAGRTAEVFEWGDDRALKLLLPGLPQAWIASEAAKTAAARAAGAPAPTVYEAVEVENRFGVVFDRVGSASMLAQILRSPWRVWGWGSRLAGIHAAVLECRSIGLPDVKEVLAAKIAKAEALPRGHRNRAKDSLGSLPDGDAVLHGDFHPDNVFLTSSGPVLIDWTEGARGCPAADLVRTLWLLSASALPPDLPRRRLVLLLVGLLRMSYLRSCLRLTQVARADLDGWWLPVAAARLSEGIEAEEAALAARVRQLVGR